MKAKYDIKKLHADCLAWCKSPKWKPWMVGEGCLLTQSDSGFIITTESNVMAAISNEHTSYSIYDKIQLFEFANFIGLDVESYLLHEIDRDQAVRDYLAGIPEGGELVDGFKKETSQGCIRAAREDVTHYLITIPNQVVWELAYTFLRLDLRGEKQ